MVCGRRGPQSDCRPVFDLARPADNRFAAAADQLPRLQSLHDLRGQLRPGVRMMVRGEQQGQVRAIQTRRPNLFADLRDGFSREHVSRQSGSVAIGAGSGRCGHRGSVFLCFVKRAMGAGRNDS